MADGRQLGYSMEDNSLIIIVNDMQTGHDTCMHVCNQNKTTDRHWYNTDEKRDPKQRINSGLTNLSNFFRTATRALIQYNAEEKIEQSTLQLNA